MTVRPEPPRPTPAVAVTPLLGGKATWVSRRNLDALSIVFPATLLLSMAICMALLFHSWNNYLVPGGARDVFGYDPYRFYFYAKDLAAKGVDLAELRAITLNYNGAVLYYATIFHVFGVLSWVPPLLNLGALGFVAKTLVRDLSSTTPSAKVVACVPLILLYPDVLWFGAMTGKELPSIILVTFIAAMAFRHSKGGIGHVSAFATSIALLLLVSLRPSLVAIPIATFLLYVGLGPRGSGLRGVIYLTLAVGALFAAPLINEVLGSRRFDAVSLLTDSLNRFDVLQQQGMLKFGSGSVSRFLYSTDPVVIILTLPLKVLWYLIAPLQNLSFSWAGVASGKWTDIQDLCTAISAIINIVILPYVLHTLLSLKDSHRSLAWRDSATFLTLFFVSSLAVVVMSGIEFHVRFRTLFVIPYILLAGLSFGITSPLLWKLRLTSYAGLGLAFLLYGAVKL